jgi:hypothetical protein
VCGHGLLRSASSALKRITDARLAGSSRNGRLALKIASSAPSNFPTKQSSRISPALVSRLHRDANSVSASVDIRNVIRRSRLLLYGGAALASLLLFAGVLKFGPREISEGVAQLVTPTTLAASPNAMSIKVRPGTCARAERLRSGRHRHARQLRSQTVTIFARPLGSKQDFQGQTMEPAKARSDFPLLDLQHSGFDGILRRVEHRSFGSLQTQRRRFTLRQTTRPDVELSRVHEPSHEDDRRRGDIAALKGTTATITAETHGQSALPRASSTPTARRSEMKTAGR